MPQYYKLAYYLRDEFGFMCKDKYIWAYNGKFYEYKSNEQLQNIVTDLTKDQASPNHLSGFVKIAIAKNQTNKELIHPQGFINLENGTLELKSRKLKEHSKKDFFRYCLPIQYDESAKCPRFLKYLEETFQGDQELIRLTFQIYGYCLMGGDPFLHKAFVLLGSGRNGKSVWLHVLKGLLGKANHSAVSIGLLNKPFSVVQMDGKLANIVGELTTGVIDSESFKTAVGGEELTASLKGKDEFGLKIDARMLFASNAMPVFKDTTAGMYEKLCILPFDRYLKPSERDPGIFKAVSKELPGILNLALEGLEYVMTHKRLIEPKASKLKIEEYRDDSDITYRWISENLEITENRADIVLTSMIYDKFRYDTMNETWQPLTKRSFGRRISQYLKTYDSKTPNANFAYSNGKARGFVGVRYSGND